MGYNKWLSYTGEHEQQILIGCVRAGWGWVDCTRAAVLMP